MEGCFIMNKLKEAAKIMLGFAIAIFIIGVCTIAIAKIAEKGDIEQFNNGICINCDEKLEPFDVDKYGNVVWLCDNCGYNCVH